MLGADPPGGVATGEVVFNTVLSGYQEVITDPSYAGQIITFTYPHIGNCGTNRTDDESRRPFCRGVIVRDLARRHSNHRSESDLGSMLRGAGVPAIGGIDTRRLTRLIRDTGALPGAFGTVSEAELLEAARAEPGTDGVDLVAQVTTDRAYTVETADGDDRRQWSPAAVRRRLRLRHQAHHPAQPRRFRTGRGGAGVDDRGRRPRPPARRRVPVERARRPDHRAVRRRRDPRPARCGPDLRDLPRPPAARVWRSEPARSSCRSVITAATTRSRTS